jgi:hypothetical protein
MNLQDRRCKLTTTHHDTEKMTIFNPDDNCCYSLSSWSGREAGSNTLISGYFDIHRAYVRLKLM